MLLKHLRIFQKLMLLAIVTSHAIYGCLSQPRSTIFGCEFHTFKNSILYIGNSFQSTGAAFYEKASTMQSADSKSAACHRILKIFDIHTFLWSGEGIDGGNCYLLVSLPQFFQLIVPNINFRTSCDCAWLIKVVSFIRYFDIILSDCDRTYV